jgi:hypothetical protein
MVPLPARIVIALRKSDQCGMAQQIYAASEPKGRKNELIP